MSIIQTLNAARLWARYNKVIPFNFSDSIDHTIDCVSKGLIVDTDMGYRITDKGVKMLMDEGLWDEEDAKVYVNGLGEDERKKYNV